jgi:hemolysin activation/secretion protein
MEQALENLKRVPGAQVEIKIVPSEADRPSTNATALAAQHLAAEPAAGQELAPAPGDSDWVIAYQQRQVFRLTLTADDSGSRSTGKFQGSATLSFDNPLALSDLFYVSLQRDLGGGDVGERGTRGHTIHYSLPLNYWGLGATYSQGRYFQNVAGATQDYTYWGTNHNLKVSLSHMLWRGARDKTKINLEGWYRSSRNFIDDTEVQVQRRVVSGWELGLEHKQAFDQGSLQASVSYQRGTGAFAALSAPEEAFGEGTSRFALLRASANIVLPFDIAAQSGATQPGDPGSPGGASSSCGLRLESEWRYQHARTRLTPQDRFAIGGRYSVRGFDGESSLVAENGWLVRNELITRLGDSGQELFVGLDYGQVSGPSSDALIGKSLTGMALGLRGGGQRWQYEVFVGKALDKPFGFKTAALSGGVRLSMSL